jgi:ubiquinone/menaquinone biosynthesis C-methylase UbiE
MSDLSIQHAIAQLVPQGSRVLDLGCGDGAMLAHLQKTRARLQWLWHRAGLMSTSTPACGAA